MSDYKYTIRNWVSIRKDGNYIILIDKSQIVMLEEIKLSYNKVITRIYLNNGLKKDIQLSLKDVMECMNFETEN